MSAYFAVELSVLPLPEAVDALRRGLSLPPNALAITFDDGYEDNLAAAEVLARHGLSATFYITAGCLAGGEPFWPSELRSLMAGIKGPELACRQRVSSLRLPVATPAEQARGRRQAHQDVQGSSGPGPRSAAGAAARGVGECRGPQPHVELGSGAPRCTPWAW